MFELVTPFLEHFLCIMCSPCRTFTLRDIHTIVTSVVCVVHCWLIDRSITVILSDGADCSWLVSSPGPVSDVFLPWPAAWPQHGGADYTTGQPPYRRLERRDGHHSLNGRHAIAGETCESLLAVCSSSSHCGVVVRAALCDPPFQLYPCRWRSWRLAGWVSNSVLTWSCSDDWTVSWGSILQATCHHDFRLRSIAIACVVNETTTVKYICIFDPELKQS